MKPGDLVQLSPRAPSSYHTLSLDWPVRVREILGEGERTIVLVKGSVTLFRGEHLIPVTAGAGNAKASG